MPFVMWTRVGPRNRVLDGVQIPAYEGTILRRGSGRPIPGYVRRRYAQSDSVGAEPVRCEYQLGVPDGVRIATTWRIRLNRSCAAAMRPYVKLLYHLFPITLSTRITSDDSCTFRRLLS